MDAAARGHALLGLGSERDWMRKEGVNRVCDNLVHSRDEAVFNIISILDTERHGFQLRD